MEKKKNATKPRNQREKKKKKKKKMKIIKKGETLLERAKCLTMDLSICVYLQKCHYNSIYIT